MQCSVAFSNPISEGRRQWRLIQKMKDRARRHMAKDAISGKRQGYLRSDDQGKFKYWSRVS